MSSNTLPSKGLRWPKKVPISALYFWQFFTYGCDKKGFFSEDMRDWLCKNSMWYPLKKYLDKCHSGHIQSLKVHKHEIILNFFWPKSNPYMPLVNFRKKFRFFSFDFRQNFDVRRFSRWLSIRGTKFVWRDIQKILFSSKCTLGSY
jgi:hypothetical protein